MPRSHSRLRHGLRDVRDYGTGRVKKGSLVKEKLKNVAVLFGGKSAEHEVSVRSGMTVLRALRDAGYHTVPIGIDRSGRWFLVDDAMLGGIAEAGAVSGEGVRVVILPGEIPGLRPANATAGDAAIAIDVVFPVLHGPFGEDGCVQGVLEILGLPYVGSGVLGSAIGMDKEVQKQLLHAAGLPVVPYTVVLQKNWAQTHAELLAWAEAIGYPVFAKPANLGSSVGVSKAADAAQLTAAVEHAFGFDRKVIVEKGYPVREIECAVLGNDEPEASVLGEIRPRHEFYSYEAKYVDPAGAELIVPAPVPEGVATRVRTIACDVFRLLQCAGMARVDFFLVNEDTVFVNEVNTIPGFTSISMYPRLWEATGVPLPELVHRLIELAVERSAARSRLSLRPN
ncbi:MAG: D-alanine--D-alanine ligase [Candidatus Binatia bacterium]|nr:D-alanine--D-alanine ligase [Candidatus Binatia bacterium]